jgi:hypothetical protein
VADRRLHKIILLLVNKSKIKIFERLDIDMI